MKEHTFSSSHDHQEIRMMQLPVTEYSNYFIDVDVFRKQVTGLSDWTELCAGRRNETVLSGAHFHTEVSLGSEHDPRWRCHSDVNSRNAFDNYITPFTACLLLHSVCDIKSYTSPIVELLVLIVMGTKPCAQICVYFYIYLYILPHAPLSAHGCYPLIAVIKLKCRAGNWKRRRTGNNCALSSSTGLNMCSSAQCRLYLMR